MSSWKGLAIDVQTALFIGGGGLLMLIVLRRARRWWRTVQFDLGPVSEQWLAERRGMPAQED